MFVGPWYAHWPGDPLPLLPRLPDFASGVPHDDAALVALAGLDRAEVAARHAAGNTPLVASLEGEAVACGWSTATTVSIGELGLSFTLPPQNRYLWGFVTAPHRRGLGLYPRLLQAALRAAGEGARCWIGHEPHNVASARGIMKAGFHPVGDVFRTQAGEFILVPTGPIERARAGAAILGATLNTPPAAE